MSPLRPYGLPERPESQRLPLIYVVEDDKTIRGLILYALQGAELSARGFENAPSFWEAWAQEKPQLVMLDIILEGEDGLSILKKLRAKDSAHPVPVIITSAKGEEYDKITGLNLGADDYLAKPFGMMEMISRIKALLRRTKIQESSGQLQKGPLVVEMDTRTVTVEGRVVTLTRKEYDLLTLLLTNPGRTFTRENLLNLVWNNEHIRTTRTVDVHIGTLRAKLGTAASLIETMRGIGYRIGGK